MNARTPEALDLGKLLLANAEQETDIEKWNAERDEVAGYDLPAREDNGALRVWSPKDRAIPPDCASGHPTSSWQSAKDETDWSTAILLGAGESALSHDWACAQGLPVYGINWTLRWFAPTILHVHDHQVVQSELIEKPDRVGWKGRTHIVTQAGNTGMLEKIGVPCTTYRTANIHERDPERPFRFADRPGEEMEYAPNSLVWALNCLHWLGAKRIILVGFDWGGYHLTGDGRQLGSICNYGLDGGTKKDLVAYIMAYAWSLHQRGVEIRQVGPTKLRGVFPRSSSLDAAVLWGRYGTELTHG